MTADMREPEAPPSGGIPRAHFQPPAGGGMDFTVQDRLADLLDRFPQARDRLDLIVEVGSTAHNISAGSDDLDLTAVWTERFEDLMTLDPSWSTKMLRTQPEGTRSGPGDIDLNIYSMRKFAALCVKGNPSVLNTLFIPEDKVLLEWAGRMGATLEPERFPRERLAALSHTKSAGRAYLGYLDSQLTRWIDGKVAQRVNRPEVVAAHSFDSKYAAHAIRLGIQGREFLETGKVTIPMREEDASRLRAIRSGQWTEREALSWCHQVKLALMDAYDASTLPEGPDAEAVRAFLVQWHRLRGVG